MKPLFLKPAISKTIWGANRISKVRGYQEDIGSWWEVSAHPNGESKVANIPGEPNLSDVLKADLDGILGPGYTLHEMLRCAYLDTKDNLSIQVHPDDAYALEHSHDYGKYESWYIVEAETPTYLVAGTLTTDAEVVRKALEENNLDPYLKKWPVKAGDYITIPNGTLHALGKNILAFEVGTNSDTTYRFYDYNRKDANGNTRPLHVKDSFNVTNFANQPEFVPAQKASHRLSDTPYFTVDEYYVDEEMTISSKEHFCVVTNIDKAPLQFTWGKETLTCGGYDSFILPYKEEIHLLPKAHVLVSNPKKGK